MQGGKRQQTSASANVCNMVETTAAALQTIEHGKAPACGFMPAGAEGLACFDQEAMCACRHYAFIRRRMNIEAPCTDRGDAVLAQRQPILIGQRLDDSFCVQSCLQAMSCVSGFASK